MSTYRTPPVSWGTYYPQLKDEETEAQKYFYGHTAGTWGALDLNTSLPHCPAWVCILIMPKYLLVKRVASIFTSLTKGNG